MTLEPSLAVGPGSERQVLELRFAATVIGQCQPTKARLSNRWPLASWLHGTLSTAIQLTG